MYAARNPCVRSNYPEECGDRAESLLWKQPYSAAAAGQRGSNLSVNRINAVYSYSYT